MLLESSEINSRLAEYFRPQDNVGSTPRANGSRRGKFYRDGRRRYILTYVNHP